MALAVQGAIGSEAVLQETVSGDRMTGMEWKGPDFLRCSKGICLSFGGGSKYDYHQIGWICELFSDQNDKSCGSM